MSGLVDAGRVALVGAGPGDPGLITVRALERLRAADVVLHDRLSSPELLRETRADAVLIDVGKSPEGESTPQERINELIVEHALGGRDVVRLKGGDPFIYGRGFEELEACRAHGVECEVVPGITSAISVPAAAGVPVTLRGVAKTLAIGTPRGAGDLGDFADLDSIAGADTISLLMGRRDLRAVASRLIRIGRSPATPVAVVQDGTLPTQRTIVGTLSTIADLADDAEIRAPSIIVIGEVARHASVARGGGLSGRRIVLTRPPSASREIASDLQRRGATVIQAPLIDVRPLDDIEWVDPADFDWLVFTSLTGVRGFARELERRDLDARAVGRARVAAVGSKTARQLRSIGIRADLVPESYRARALCDAMVSRLRAGDRVLFPCGTLALDEVPERLGAAGIRVHTMRVYETRGLDLTPTARAAIERGVDAILFYSPSAVESFVAHGVGVGSAAVVCVGPTTADAARARGVRVDAVPDVYGDRGMLSVVEQMFQSAEVLA